MRPRASGASSSTPPSVQPEHRAAKSDGKIPLGTGFNRLPGGLAVLAGFGLTGDVSVALTPASGATPAGAEISAHLKLPDFLDPSRA